MLVLTRRSGESIIIEDVIKIKVLSINPGGNAVKIGIEAPAGIKILREELNVGVVIPAGAELEVELIGDDKGVVLGPGQSVTFAGPEIVVAD